MTRILLQNIRGDFSEKEILLFSGVSTEMAVFNAFVMMASLVRTVPPAKILTSALKIQPYVKMAYVSMTRYINERFKKNKENS